MNDLIFYPVAMLAALAIIASAALPGRDRLSCGSSVSGAGTNYFQVSVTGDGLCRIEAAGQSDIQLVQGNDELESVVISAGAGQLGDRPERNPHFRLAADLEQFYAGSRIRVTVEARPARPQGAMSFEVNYSAGNEGNSGWRTFDLQNGYQSFSFEWDVPLRETQTTAVDYLSIRPVVPEKTRGVEIRAVRLERVGQGNRPGS